MQTISRLDKLRGSIAARRDEVAGSPTLALVPTMGALHEGHLTLVREAKALADIVVVSIFVNPRQFGPDEDLDAYPRRLADDADKLTREGVDLLWAPEAGTMYPTGFATNVSVAGVSGGLCGADRPGHFDGVATVVAKLFNQIGPDVALFGEKDWQQLAVIRRMARDLDFRRPHPDRIVGVPIVREADGLAMSSRNAYLSPEQRAAAAALPAAMRRAIDEMHAGKPSGVALAMLRDKLMHAGFDSVDYAELRDADSLAALDAPTPNARLFVAACIGGTRLIDNMAAGGASALPLFDGSGNLFHG